MAYTATAVLLGAPDFNEAERELDLLEASWADFVHGCRTGMLCMRDGTALEKFAGDLTQIRLQFDAYRQRFNDGDATALLEALQLACNAPVPLPYWLALELRARTRRVWNEPISLHEAFGLDLALPARGKKAVAARRRISQRKRIYWMVTRMMRDKEVSLDAALRRVLEAGGLHIGLTTARRLFIEQDRIQRVHLGKRPIKAPTVK